MNRGGSSAVKGHGPEGGYALLLAVFLAATMFLLAMVAAPTIVNQGRRAREQQLIWRGNQYVRGIRLFFQKNGRYPQNRDELVKGTLSVHFLRKAFTDPVSQSGDDWRLIYVNPSGQLIGSVRYHTLQEMAAALGAQNLGNMAALLGGAANAQPATNAGGAPVGPVGARGGPGAAAASTAGPGGQAAAGAGGQTGGAQTATGTQDATGMGQQQTPVALQAVDGPVFGGSMIGIASKVKQDSLLVYQGKENYFQWEFIFNPLLNGGAAAPQQAGVGVGVPGTGLPTGAGIGGAAPGQPAGGAAGQPPPMGQTPFGTGRGGGGAVGLPMSQ
jgi:hypothetical protein